MVILACAPVSGVLVFVDDRMLDGSLVWLKPLKFQVSVAVFLFTLAFVMPLAGERFRGSGLGRSVVWIAIVTSVFEIFWITLQAARGERSHYHEGSAFGAAMYVAMGVAAVLLSLTPVAVAVATCWNPLTDARLRILRTSLLLGVAVTLLGSAGVGLMLGGSPDHYPGPNESTDADERLPLVGWSTTGGDLRIAHFVGLHAFQGMLILGLLCARLPVRRAQSILLASAFAWFAVTVLLVWTALADRAPWPMGLL